jgi:aldehyde:ferredoxin oxidoreductase
MMGSPVRPGLTHEVRSLTGTARCCELLPCGQNQWLGGGRNAGTRAADERGISVVKPTTIRLRRYEDMHGWANRVLRVDLSDMRIWAHDVAAYVPGYLGARGIAAKIAWDEYAEPVEPFDPRNPLMIFPGALTGSRAPYSGRTNVCSFSPQASPHPWFTRSSVGGRFGGELKRAGYDGLIVTGAAEGPVQIQIRDDEVSIQSADDLWGLDAMDTLEAIKSRAGKRARALAIGQAGESLSRIATIQSDSSSACGQGGFGAVMGAKKLKAICVAGSGRVSLAAPQTVVDLSRALARQVVTPDWLGRDMGELNRQLAAQGSGRVRLTACTEGCVTPCQAHYEDVPGVVTDRKWGGDWVCVGGFFRGAAEDGLEPMRSAYDWQLGTRAAFEMNVLTNRYGLNQFDIVTGMVPWLIQCQKAGLISDMNGDAMDWRSAEFWAMFLRSIAYREGLGDALAEGGWAASRALHIGEGLAASVYPGWGHPTHWDGRNGWDLPFPDWVAPVLLWMSDTRDPFATCHGALRAMRAVRPAWETDKPQDADALVAAVRAMGERVYGSSDATDPYSGYEFKARVGHFHTQRPVIKDCVPVDDHCFPLIWNPSSPDHRYRFPDIDGLGVVEGPSVEYHLFAAGTGTGWPESEFEVAAERVHTLERALQVRHWGRDRGMDEMALPYFEQPESCPNPFLSERHSLDRERFEPVLQEFYTLHGWDVARGWPTRERLGELGLSDVYDPMIAGATKANGTREDKDR